jgi:hypothetical protein
VIVIHRVRMKPKAKPRIRIGRLVYAPDSAKMRLGHVRVEPPREPTAGAKPWPRE